MPLFCQLLECVHPVAITYVSMECSRSSVNYLFRVCSKPGQLFIGFYNLGNPNYSCTVAMK